MIPMERNFSSLLFHAYYFTFIRAYKKVSIFNLLLSIFIHEFVLGRPDTFYTTCRMMCIFVSTRSRRAIHGRFQILNILFIYLYFSEIFFISKICHSAEFRRILCTCIWTMFIGQKKWIFMKDWNHYTTWKSTKYSVEHWYDIDTHFFSNFLSIR